MRVQLTDGRQFRISFRHIVPNNFVPRQGATEAQFDRYYEECDRLAERLRFYSTTVSFDIYRIEALSECFIQEVIEGVAITRDADPIGAAFTNYKDHFDKEKGRKISLTRALQHLFKDPTIRKEFWDAYHNRFPQPIPKEEADVVGRQED